LVVTFWWVVNFLGLYTHTRLDSSVSKDPIQLRIPKRHQFPKKVVAAGNDHPIDMVQAMKHGTPDEYDSAKATSSDRPLNQS
jgi:hypothetical protein